MSKATSCKDAIKKWEANTGLVPAEAIEVKLICQLPPIDKMDESLNQFEACVKLSLSTNAIECMIALPKFKSLKILSLSRNHKIRSWDEVGKLSQLPEIKNVLFVGNAIYGDKGAENYKENNAPLVYKRIPRSNLLMESQLGVL